MKQKRRERDEGKVDLNKVCNIDERNNTFMKN